MTPVSVPAVRRLPTRPDVAAEYYHLAPEKLIDGNPRQTVWIEYEDPSGQFCTGIWASEVGAWRIHYTEQEYCRILEGRSLITHESGASETVTAGDEFVIPCRLRRHVARAGTDAQALRHPRAEAVIEPPPSVRHAESASQNESLLMNDLPPLPDVVPGRYRHYKGGEYELLGVVRHSETREALVLYRALYGEAGLWVRPHVMFFEDVDLGGSLVPRFARVRRRPLNSSTYVDGGDGAD